MAAASPPISRSSSHSDAPPSNASSAAPSPDRNGRRSQDDAEIQSAAALKSEEYRQLFRLPPEEVLIEDFNCACQENILIQGHMYLFVHYICFYSNIFGFETKKIIPFQEVTSVQRAKTAGIFPNAIEIIAGDKKHFFASFLSRDEAFKIITKGWLQHGNAVPEITEQQDSSESSSPESGLVITEKANGDFIHDDATDRSERDLNLKDSESPVGVKDEMVPASLPEIQPDAEEDALPIQSASSSSSGKALPWKGENCDAPKIPEYYTKVAESRFPIKVEEFFSFFFSDDAANFTQSFHDRCGDKDFRSSLWYSHGEYGRARDLSFQHPIKVYFGPKFGSCQELQKLRVYKDSHLVIETSQEINDVPYGDCFRVQGLWNVERDKSKSTESCVLRVYVNVAFSKKTMWKGKIVQSTLDECRDTYSIWINMAHELLKQKNLEKQEAAPDSSMIQNQEVHVETTKAKKSSKRPNGRLKIQQSSDSTDTSQQVDSLAQGSLNHTVSVSSHLGESMLKILSSLRSQKHLPLLLAITFGVIILMQLSILVLLGRPQHVHVSSPVGYGSGLGSGIGDRFDSYQWLEKRMHYLKDEMLMIEARLERMRHEHALLKTQLNDLEQLRRHKR